LNTIAPFPTSLTLNRKIGRYTLVYGDLVVEQRICEFLSTYAVVTGIDLEEYLSNTADNYDTVRIPLSTGGTIIQLDIHHFFTFKKLYQEEMQQLQLEDMLIRLKITASSEALIFV
jgi:hypothetical protein